MTHSIVLFGTGFVVGAVAFLAGYIARGRHERRSQ